MHKLNIISCIALILLCACNKTEMIDVVKLGAVEKTIHLPLYPGADTIHVVTYSNYTVRTLPGSEWLTMRNDGLQPSTRSELPFRYAANNSYCRMAKVLLIRNERTDTVFIKQEGPLKESVTLKEHSIQVPAQGGEYSIPVEAYLPVENLHVMTSSSKAIASAEYADNKLCVTVAPTTYKDSRTYSVTIYYINAWDEQVSDTVSFIQSPAL